MALIAEEVARSDIATATCIDGLAVLADVTTLRPSLDLCPVWVACECNDTALRSSVQKSQHECPEIASIVYQIIRPLRTWTAVAASLSWL